MLLWNVIPYFDQKFEKTSQNLSFAAVVIGALRVNTGSTLGPLEMNKMQNSN